MPAVGRAAGRGQRKQEAPARLLGGAGWAPLAPALPAHASAPLCPRFHCSLTWNGHFSAPSFPKLSVFVESFPFPGTPALTGLLWPMAPAWPKHICG